MIASASLREKSNRRSEKLPPAEPISPTSLNALLSSREAIVVGSVLEPFVILTTRSSFALNTGSATTATVFVAAGRVASRMSASADADGW